MPIKTKGSGAAGAVPDGVVSTEVDLTEDELVLGAGEEAVKTLEGSNWNGSRLLVPGASHAEGFVSTQEVYLIEQDDGDVDGADFTFSILNTGPFIRLQYTGNDSEVPSLDLEDVADGSAFFLYFTSTESDPGVLTVDGVAGSVSIPLEELVEVIRVGSGLFIRKNLVSAEAALTEDRLLIGGGDRKSVASNVSIEDVEGAVSGWRVVAAFFAGNLSEGSSSPVTLIGPGNLALYRITYALYKVTSGSVGGEFSLNFIYASDDVHTSDVLTLASEDQVGNSFVLNTLALIGGSVTYEVVENTAETGAGEFAYRIIVERYVGDFPNISA